MSKPYTPWSTIAPMTPEFHEGLMPHQVDAVRLASDRRHFLIAHEQGTGKTITGIMLARTALAVNLRPVLVVVPPSLAVNWENEFAKWSPNTTVVRIKNREPLDTEHAQYAGLPDADVIIATDGTLSGYANWFIGGERRFTWDEVYATYTDANGKTKYLKDKQNRKLPRMNDDGTRFIPNYIVRDFGRGVGAVIVDECQRVSNMRAGRSGAFLHLCTERPAMPKWLLSGTPFTKTRIGLYNLMSALDVFDAHSVDGTPCDAQAWLNHFAPRIAGDRYGSRGVANTEQLHDEMFHATTGWAHRVRTADVISDLPNMGRVTQAVEIAGEWATKYRKAEKDLEAWLIETRGYAKAESMMRAEALIRVQELRRLAGKAKMQGVIDTIALIVGESCLPTDHADYEAPEQVLVVCNHTDIREHLLAHFTGKGFRTATIHGGQTVEQKQAVVDAWQESEVDIVVANVLSASVGFTMTAGRHIVFAELPWNSGDLVQSEARLLRLGQKREVVSLIPLATKPNGDSTIDARLWAMLESKHREAKGVLDGEQVDTLTTEAEESIAMAILRSYLADLT